MTAWLDRLGDGVRGLKGWRRVGLAFLAGRYLGPGLCARGIFSRPASGLCRAGFAAGRGGIEAHAPGASPRCAGWAFAFGQYLIGWHWIGYAFMVDPSAHLWQMPFAILFLSAGLALYAGIACALAMLFWQDGLARLLIFAAFYAVGEWVRGHALTGFPWNLPAYGWGASWAVMQSASVIGAYGLSFLTILLGASLAEFCAAPRTAAPLAMILLFACLWVYGARPAGASRPPQIVPGIMVRLVQPDVPQNEKYVPPLCGAQLAAADGSFRTARARHPHHLARSRAAIPARPLAHALDADRGADQGQPQPDHRRGAARCVSDGEPRFYNRLYIFGPGGKMTPIYDKFHLVPFGEYVPFAASAQPHRHQQADGRPDRISAGDGPHIYPVPDAPAVTPLICYEIIFPGAVTSKSAAGMAGQCHRRFLVRALGRPDAASV